MVSALRGVSNSSLLIRRTTVGNSTAGSTQNQSNRSELALASDLQGDRSFDPASDLSTFQTERIALKARSRTRIRQDEDGNLRATNRTNLRFQYDLETGDGQRIRLRAKAKLKQTVVQDENGDLAVKTKVKFQFRLIQQDVNRGLGSVAQSDGDNRALDAFSNVLESLGTEFADDGAIDADELVASIVNAFNELYEQFAGEPVSPNDVAPQAGDPDGIANAGVSVRVQIRNAAADIEPVSSGEPDPITSVQQQPATLSAESVAIETSPESTSATAVDETAEDEATDVEQVDDVEQVESNDEPDDIASISQSNGDLTENDRREAIQQVRLRFVQSFSQVIETLTPEGDSGQSSLLVRQQFNQRLTANISYLA